MQLSLQHVGQHCRRLGGIFSFALDSKQLAFQFNLLYIWHWLPLLQVVAVSAALLSLVINDNYVARLMQAMSDTFINTRYRRTAPSLSIQYSTAPTLLSNIVPTVTLN